MRSGGGSFSHLSLHVGTDWRVDCHTYDDDHTPILSVDAGSTAIACSLDNRLAGKAAVQFARALAREAQVFAAEVERLHADRAATGDSSTKAAGDTAA